MTSSRPLLARAVLVAVALGAGVALAVQSSSAQDEPEPGSPQPSVDRGRAIYLAGCSSCHGRDAQGISGLGPSLIEVGAANADYQLRTGRMPAADVEGQPQRKEPAYDAAQIHDLVAYVATLGTGPAIPEYRVDDLHLARGLDVYVGNCAPCHGATGNGGATGEGWIAPPLDRADPLTVAEAILVGPGQMPAFPFDARDRDAVVTYVEWLKTSPDPGGLEIGGIGPVPEGLVAWTFGMGLLVISVILIGREWEARPPTPPEGSDR